MKFGTLMATCEGCGCSELIQASLSKRTFTRYLNRFVREHRMHEYKKKVGVGVHRKVGKSEQQKRTLRRMPTYGATKQ
jgi:hypothetical protein